MTAIFFMKTIRTNDFPDKVLINKSGANVAGLENMNCWLNDILQVKYLNNIIEHNHRFIKKLTKQMKCFKTLMSASATLDGIEVAHMIPKSNLESQ